MSKITMKCPKCGSDLTFDSGDSIIYCKNCGVKCNVNSGDNKNNNKFNAQNIYDEELSRRMAAIDAKQYEKQFKDEKKKRTGLWVLGWIFCFPIPLTVLIVKSKTLKVGIKALLVIALWGGLILYSNFHNGASNYNSLNNIYEKSFIAFNQNDYSLYDKNNVVVLVEENELIE